MFITSNWLLDFMGFVPCTADSMNTGNQHETDPNETKLFSGTLLFDRWTPVKKTTGIRSTPERHGVQFRCCCQGIAKGNQMQGKKQG